MKFSLTIARYRAGSAFYPLRNIKWLEVGLGYVRLNIASYYVYQFDLTVIPVNQRAHCVSKCMSEPPHRSCDEV